MYGFGRDTFHILGASIGGAIGTVAGDRMDMPVVAAGVGALVGAAAQVAGNRVTKKVSTQVGRAVGPEISGGDTNELRDALMYALHNAGKTAAEAEPALAMIDRIMATLEQAGGRRPPREITDALQDLEDARGLMKEASELGRSASADIESALDEIYSR